MFNSVSYEKHIEKRLKRLDRLNELSKKYMKKIYSLAGIEDSALLKKRVTELLKNKNYISDMQEIRSYQKEISENPHRNKFYTGKLEEIGKYEHFYAKDSINSLNEMGILGKMERSIRYVFGEKPGSDEHNLLFCFKNILRFLRTRGKDDGKRIETGEKIIDSFSVLYILDDREVYRELLNEKFRRPKMKYSEDMFDEINKMVSYWENELNDKFPLSPMNLRQVS